MLLRGRPAAVAWRHQASPKQRHSQAPGFGAVPCREQCLNQSCAAFSRDGSGEQSQPGDWSDDSHQSSWAADNVSSGQIYTGNMYSHNLPWKGYTRMMFMAIEAEADSKQEVQDAYDGCLDPNSDSSIIASSLSMLEGDSRHTDEEDNHSDNYHSAGNRFGIDIPPASPLPPSTGFTQHLQTAMEAHGAAQELRQAAEDEAQRFFDAMSAASGTGATCREDWAAQPADHSAVFMELEASIQQGIQAAHDQFVIALRLARSLLHNTQRALADCAEKLRLEMSLQPANPETREQQAAALQQLQDLTEETMDDLAARLTSQFLPANNLSSDEAREWLEELWMLDVPPALDSGSEEGC